MIIHKSYLILPESSEEWELLSKVQHEVHNSEVFIGFKGCGGYGAFSLRNREDFKYVVDKLHKQACKVRDGFRCRVCKSEENASNKSNKYD